MSWPKTADGQYYLFEGRVLIPVDPSTGVAQLFLRPTGGMGIAIPAIAEGAPGVTPVLSPTVNITELAWDDTNPAAASFTPIGLNAYQLSVALHGGAPGDATSSAILDSTDLTGSPTAKYTFVINSGANGVEIVAQKVGDRYTPASVNSISAGNANATLASVSIPAQPFDWRPEASGYCLITGTGADVQVDVIARLANASSGNQISRGTGRAGQYPDTHILVPGPLPGQADSYDRISAGNGATIYFRAERQSGSDTFTTSASTTLFRVKVIPIP